MEDSPQDQPHTPSSGSSARRRILFVLAVLALAGGSFYGALIVATQVDEVLFPGNGIRLSQPLGRLPGIDSGHGERPTRRINILVMGLDRRPREGEAPTRTDTMFVVTIDPNSKRAGMLGIPRDLWVEIPGKDGGYFEGRINTAYAIGETQGYSGGGAKLAIDTVEHALGVSVDHYIVIDFEGFKTVIDALGGIEVDVPEDLVDYEYSESELPGDFDPQEFFAGVQHMDGSRALAYARIRRGSDDLDRIQRQQRVIYATIDKALALDVIPNALNLWRQFKNTIETDINDTEIIGLAPLAAAIPPDRIVGLSLGPAVVPYTTPDGAAVLLISEAGVRQIVDSLFSDQDLVEENALVELQNGTGEVGLAGAVKDYLVGLGLSPADLVASNSELQSADAETQIVDFTGKRYTAQKLAEWLGVPADRVRSAIAGDEALRFTEADIVVIVGSDVQIDQLTAAPTSGG